MEKAKHSIQFEAEVDSEGNVVFSKRVDDLQLRAGAKVTVNIFGGVLSKQLSKLGVTEKEIERIGTLQLEDREHVITFLSAQGVLKKSGIQKRVVRV
jgi:hypothetical protein